MERREEDLWDIGINKGSNEEFIEGFCDSFFCLFERNKCFWRKKKKVCGRKCFLKEKFLFLNKEKTEIQNLIKEIIWLKNICEIKIQKINLFVFIKKLCFVGKIKNNLFLPKI